MRILLVGAGGVGSAFAAIAARRDFFEQVVVTDYDLARAEKAAAVDDRYVAAKVDASDATSVTALCREHGITHVMNAVDPIFNMPIFEGALAAGADYLDMAMSLSKPHPEAPYEKTGVKLGDEQFAVAGDWESSGRLALVGIGVEPGLSDVFARYAADHLFSEIDELHAGVLVGLLGMRLGQAHRHVEVVGAGLERAVEDRHVENGVDGVHHVGDAVLPAQGSHGRRVRGVDLCRDEAVVRRRGLLGPRQVVVGHHDGLEEVAPGGDGREGTADATGSYQENPHHSSFVSSCLDPRLTTSFLGRGACSTLLRDADRSFPRGLLLSRRCSA